MNKLELVLIFILLFLTIVLGTGMGILISSFENTTDISSLEDFKPEIPSKIYDRSGILISEIFTIKREPVIFEKLPKNLINALLAIEDDQFYSHRGINVKRVFGAFIANIKSKRITQGASTITMQLSRDITYLTRQKLIVRKIKEILTALKIEQTYTKREIIEMYLNQYDFGRMSFGIGSVSFTYFSKKAEDLTLEESALIISLLPAPSAYSPLKNTEISFKRRNLVLKCMLHMNYITEKEYKEAIVKPIELNVGYRSNEDKAPYFSEYIRKLVDEKSDELGINLYEDGLNIYTTLDLKLQKIAEESLLSQLDVMQKKLHLRLNKLHKETGADTTVQGSFIAIDPRNGHILAMVGGKDYGKSQFSRATQSKRQPGSCFKPFVWTAAIDNGYSPNYELWDQEVVVHQYDGTNWRPQNYTKKRGGLTTIREGLKRSLNNISTRIVLELLGTPKSLVKYANNMGIKSELRAVNSISMGTSEVTLLELASAYCVFPNKGVFIEPIAIAKITDRSGKVIYEAQTNKREAISEETAYLMVSMLQSAMEPGGTGYSSRTIYGLKRPTGGKTGTTQEFTDAWYMGFIPQIAAGTWIGFDDPLMTLGQKNSGAVVALPVWAKFMKTACDTLNLPVEDFEMPDGIIPLTICKDTKLIATKYCPDVEHEVFNRKNAPTDTCTIHNPYSRR